MKTNFTNRALHGLYAITNHQVLGINRLLEDVEATLQSGTRMVQYRDKSNDPKKRHAEAKALLKLCEKYNVPLIINDDCDLAASIGAAGVHLGKDDNALSEARARLGAKAIIGISCYNDLTQATLAEKNGANYVAFGRFFASLSKPDAIQANPPLLQDAKHKLSIPIVAIGGITPENGGLLISAGASMLAVIQGIFSQADISVATQNFLPLFNPVENSSS